MATHCQLPALGLAALLLGLTPRAQAAPPPQRGIALGMFSSDADERYAPYLDEIAAQGASHVSLVTVWYQHDIRAEQLQPRTGFTPSDATLERTIDEAQARGLQVMLFPIIGIEVRAANEWRGRLAPASWDGWFQSYRTYILHMARIAAAHRVAIFSVGSELLTTEKMRDRWVALIDEVRALYKGQVLYSANWDHYEPVSFWDRVDLLGVTGYYELTRGRDPKLDELVSAWRRWQQPLTEFARRRQLPLVFTEIGYPALDGSNIYPWDETRQESIDLAEQALCYEAFIKAWDAEPTLSGVYFWNWFGKGGSRDGDYTPRGKPASRVMQRWYAQPRPRGR